MKKLLLLIQITLFLTFINCSEDINDPRQQPFSGNWNKLSTSGDSPPERDAHSLVYDSQSHRIILFGGFYPGVIFSDVYSLDLHTRTWEKLSEGPLQRAYHTAALDNITNRMIVFGGGDSVLATTNQTWQFDLDTKQWSQITTTGTIPPARNGNASFFDSRNNRFIIFGGGSKAGVYNETYALDLTSDTWQKIAVSGEPPDPRAHMGYSWAGNDSTIIIFGGEDNYGQFFRDVFVLNIETWVWTKLITFSTPPSGRSGCAMEFFPDVNAFAVFGGFATVGSLNDAYAFTVENRNWNEIRTEGDIPERRIPFGSIYNPLNKSMIVFGGWNGFLPPDDKFYNDVYELSVEF